MGLFVCRARERQTRDSVREMEAERLREGGRGESRERMAKARDGEGYNRDRERLPQGRAEVRR